MPSDLAVELLVCVEFVGCLDDVLAAIKVSLNGYLFFEALESEDINLLIVD